VRLLWDVRGTTPESVDLPVDGFITSGGAAVLGLRQPDAASSLAAFG
jgi:hypothetical protein